MKMAPGPIPWLLALLAFAAPLGGCGEKSDLDAVACARGALDCPCRRDFTCDVFDGVALLCVDDVCRPPDCPPGTLDCPCNAGTCAAGLECSDVTGEAACQARVLCPIGTHGCACYPDETCDPLADGAPQRCDDGACVPDVCARGERDCQCLPGERCLDDGDICDMGLCVEDTGQTVVPPPEPRCYTPCRYDLRRPDGPDRVCDEGLLPGCIGDALCADGSCVLPEALAAAPAMVTACRFDASCPDFQTCIAGRCYSDCEESADCRGERVCHRKACRLPCSVADDVCPRGEHCSLFDGVSGHCMPLGLPRSDLYKQAAPGAAAAFRVDTAAIELSPLRAGASFAVTSESDVDQQITVRRVWHKVRGSDTEIRDPALGWVRLAADGGPSTLDDLVLTVPARGELTVHVSEAVPPADTPPAGGWSGRLELTNPSGGRAEVTLTYAVGVTGSWAGALVLYANFSAAHLTDPQAPGDGVSERTNNALARRWLALRKGTIRVAEFEAMLRAIRDESWEEPLVRERCARAYPGLDPALCYLYDGGGASDPGIRAMTNRPGSVQVPSGPVELPWSMTIDQMAATPGTPEFAGGGRVDSDATLHVPGNPALRLRFEGDPTACPAPPQPCVNRLVPGQVLVRTRVGGRAWAAPCPAGLVGRRVPWFVPLFGGGAEARAGCFAESFPFADAGLSRGLSRANPLPDGRALDVTVEIVDGALLEQRTLFALTRQTISGVFGEDETRYGYLLLDRADDARAIDPIRPGAGAPGDARVEQVACDGPLLRKALGRPGPTALTDVRDDELPALLTALTRQPADVDGQAAPALPAFAEQMEAGFGYRTQFANREGLGVGFTPEACVADVNPIPYCYDADAIEEARARIDCAARVRLDRFDRLDDAQRRALDRFLSEVHAFTETRLADLPTPVISDGFERAYAELLVMLGDEAMTRGFASRYDLAEQRLADFPGADLEEDGIDLSGQAGFELLSFYQGAQYFQLVLDRFFGKAPLIREGVVAGFAGPRMAVSWLPRVLGASTKKARAMAEIAERYVTFDRADLARGVIRRAFAAAWLESVVILQLFERVARQADAETQAQVRAALREAQLTFSAALRDMRSSFEAITDEPAVFGIPRNFVPFPALDAREVNSRAINAFDVALERARGKLAIAVESETEALNQARQFDVDEAAFIDEMARIKREYDNTLSELCGSFESGGNVYPAVARYAAEMPPAQRTAEPCGLVDNGAIFSKLQEIAALGEQVESVRRRIAALQVDSDSLQRQMDAQCARVKAFSDYQFDDGSAIRSTRVAISGLERSIDTLDKIVSEASEIRDATTCIVGTSTDCPTKMAGMGVYLGVATASIVAQGTLEAQVVVQEDRIEETLLNMQRREILQECEAITIDLREEMVRIVSEVPALESEMAALELDHRRLKGELGGLRNDAASAQANRRQADELRINSEIARNDPNVRIYRNAAMIVADGHFTAALREAYAATRVFEYYTSQSYAARDELLLIRLAGRGERNLRDYLLALEEAFFAFEQVYANPDLRLHVVSLRDLGAERLTGQTAATVGQRNVSFREKLKRDVRGHYVFDFRTALGDTSPLTADHKVLYIEADLVGRNLGDGLGRVYLSLPEDNTGTVLGVEGGSTFYTFPARTAVLNPTFNGKRGAGGVEFDRALFRSERLRDRPLVNTHWEVRIDRDGESVNADIDMSQLEDVVFYIYYTDFTTGL